MKIFTLVISVILSMNLFFYQKPLSLELKDKDIKLNVSARCAIAMDSKTKRVLFEKNAYTIVPMASTTKIVTALVALKYGDLEKKVVISDKAANIHGSTVGYRKGEMISIKELLYGLMFKSGNDAAIALAEGIGGSIEGFCKLMNEYGKRIGLLDSSFESPHGLDSLNHYSTAYDLAIVTAKAKEENLFNEIVGCKDLNGKDIGFTRDYHNINKILWQVPSATGVKTGYTGGAGKCLVSSFKIKGSEIIVVVLNCPNRWEESKKINDYISKQFDFKTLVKEKEKLCDVKIKNSTKKIEVFNPKDIVVPIKNNADYKYTVNIYKNLNKVTDKNPIGILKVYENEEEIYNEVIYATESVTPKAPSWFDRLFKRDANN